MRRLLENIKIAFQALFLNKLRSLLTMLGIIIGVGSVVAMFSIGAGAQQSVLGSIQDMGSNLIIITPGNPEEENYMGAQLAFGTQQAELTIDDLRAIEREATLITDVAPVIFSSSVASYLNKSTQSTVFASTEDGREIYNMKIDKGNFYSRSDVSNALNVAVIGQTVVKSLFGKTDPIGKIIKLDGKNFKVIGTLEARGTDALGNDQDSSISIPVTTAQDKLYGLDSYNMIMAQSVSEKDIDAASEEIKSILRRHRNIRFGEKEDFMVQNQTQILDMVNTVTGIFTVVIAGIASISLLVGGIGIMNIMLVSVTERTREIGIRKAIGAKNRDILIQFLVESIVLSITGGILGILFAVSVSAILSRFTILVTSITVFPIIIALSFSTVIGLFFGIFPAMRAARLNPIDALRYE
ncbi:MAG: ABC transporter permease [Actinobacteria bacterium]|nr:ABC transporter permease [Actinomycetota bacterium]